MIKGETLWAQTKGKLYASEGFEDGSMEERSSFLGLNQTKREVKRMFKFVYELLQLSTQSTSYTTAPFSNTAENSQVVKKQFKTIEEFWIIPNIFADFGNTSILEISENFFLIGGDSVQISLNWQIEHINGLSMDY